MANIGISQQAQDAVAHRLNIILADEYILFTKLFKYHWNVTGMSFGPLHALFQEQYEELFKIIDDVAERVRALDHMAIGTLSEFQEHTRLQEKPGQNPDAAGMISDLIHDYEQVIRSLRDDIDIINEHNDSVTANFVEEMIEKHEKRAWMLRAHLT